MKLRGGGAGDVCCGMYVIPYLETLPDREVDEFQIDTNSDLCYSCAGLACFECCEICC